MKPTTLQRASFSCLVAVLGACGSGQARVSYGGTSVKGEILSSSDDFVYVQKESGKVVSVPRTQIEEVEHPGQGDLVFDGVAVASGLGVSALGIYLIESDPEHECPNIDIHDRCSGPAESTNEFLGSVVLGLGLAATTAGLVSLISHIGQSAESEERLSSPSPRITPTFAASPQGGTVGLHAEF